MKKLVYSLFLAMFLASGIGLAFAIDPQIPFVGILLLMGVRALLGAQVERGVLADAVDLTALTAYAGKNQRALLATMVNKLAMLSDVMVLPNVKNKLRIGKLTVGAGTRPFSSTEEFQEGDLAYTDRFLEVSQFKRELKIDPSKYRTSYLSEFMAPGTNANKAEIPFEQFTWMEVFKAFWAEINNSACWDGFDIADAVAFDAGDTYAAGDYISYTPTGTTVKQWYKCLATTTAGQDPDDTPAKWRKVTASAIFKGFGTLITEEIAATNIAAEAIGAITATAGVARAAFKELFREMPTVYQEAGVIINCSYTDFQLLQDDIEEVSKYTRHDNTMGPGQTPSYMFLPGTNNRCIVKPGTWITGRRMIAGPLSMAGGQPRNAALLFGTDLLSDFNAINIMQSELWQLKAGITALGGVQIANLEEIRVNDQV